MKTLAPHDRPREKLDRLGPSGLGDNELLAAVLGHGHGRVSALELANAVLERAGGLQEVLRLGRDELRRIPGVGAARAAQILAAIELGRRTLIREPRDRPQFLTTRDAAAYLVPQFGSASVERFGIVLIDTKHRVMRTRIISVGSLDASMAHPREVFREAVAAGAAGVVLFHNHPSGDPTPSPDDVALTRRLVAAGDLVGVEVVDHMILCEAAYFSFKEKQVF
jgi:DNA repair protein RadC